MPRRLTRTAKRLALAACLAVAISLVDGLLHAEEGPVKAAAQAEGVSTEQWLQHLVEKRLQSAAELPPISSQPRRPLSARIREIWADMPEDVRAKLPADGASQHDHYIYGVPKIEQ